MTTENKEEPKAKKRIIIRTLSDLLDFQVMRWKKKYPDAAEPEEWSENEIKPDDHFDPSEELSESDVKVILEDDQRWVGSDAGKGMKRRGTYEKGWGKRANAAVQDQIKAEQDAHYAKRLEEAAAAMAKEYELDDEYEIVFEGEYAQAILAQKIQEKD